MTVLTGDGSFANTYVNKFNADVCSIRELGEDIFLQKLSEADTIIHNAATINPSDSESYIKKNFDFSRFLIKHLQSNNPNAHLVLLSSMSILDRYDDDAYGNVLEMSSYAYSKYLSETYALRSTLKNVSSVRFSTLFYMDPLKDGLSKLIYDAVTHHKITIYNNGVARRNFIPIDIAADYVEMIVTSAEVTKSTYNICADSSVSFSDVVAIVKRHIPDLEVENKIIDNTTEVLYEFSSKDIDRLGQIPFNIEDLINRFIVRLTST